jgi:antitoxin VapB
MATTTRVFKSGGSQAVRIPKEYRIEGDTVLLDRADDGLLLRPAASGRAQEAGRSPAAARPRRPGFLKGKVKIGRDFDAPLPPRILRDFGQR